MPGTDPRAAAPRAAACPPTRPGGGSRARAPAPRAARGRAARPAPARSTAPAAPRGTARSRTRRGPRRGPPANPTGHAVRLPDSLPSWQGTKRFGKPYKCERAVIQSVTWQIGINTKIKLHNISKCRCYNNYLNVESLI